MLTHLQGCVLASAFGRVTQQPNTAPGCLSLLGGQVEILYIPIFALVEWKYLMYPIIRKIKHLASIKSVMSIITVVNITVIIQKESNKNHHNYTYQGMAFLVPRVQHSGI